MQTLRDRDRPRVPWRPRLVRALLHAWPLARGRHRLQRLLLSGFEDWPPTASFDFDFGRMVDASLQPWPRGFRELYLHGHIDADDLTIWTKVLSEGDSVIDGGANWGYWTLVASHLTGASGRVFAFEPVPSTADALSRNVQASGAHTVEVHRMALARTDEPLELHLFDDDPFGGASSAGEQGGRAIKTTIHVPSVTLDALVAERGIRPTLVKLDIEGGEMDAILGAEAVLSGDQPPIVTFEWNVTAATSFGYHPAAIVEHLAGFGMEAFLADDGELVPFQVRSTDPGWIPMVWAIPGALVSHLR